jgi:hypothetical protein
LLLAPATGCGTDTYRDCRFTCRAAVATRLNADSRVGPDAGRSNVILRDAELVPALRRVVAEDATSRQRIRDSLAAGWGARGGRRRLLLAAIGHALEFETWRSVARYQGLDDERAAELITRLACAAASRSTAPRRRGGTA